MLLCQCSFGPSATEKAEAGRINHAVDQLRNAPNADKGALLEALKGLSCETPALCELQRVCIEGYAGHVAALNETALAKTLLQTPRAEARAAEALEHATQDLAAAAPKIARCTDAQGVVQRKYKL